MSGLARILLDKKVVVSGSDLASSVITEGLQNQGATISVGQQSKNISPNIMVVFSTDIKEDNPEYKAAVKLKCHMLHRSELLIKLTEGLKTLAVTGTHGKTTTSALLAWVLAEAGCDPSFAVGGIVQNFQSNGRHGKGEFFVAEADESDGSFCRFHPEGAIVTNIGLDHMNYYQTEERLLEAFSTFMDQVGRLFWCGDDERLQALRKGGISYGFGERCQLRASHFRQEGFKAIFDVSFEGKQYRDLELALVGRHNVLNALGVFGLALKLGVAEQPIRQAFQTFLGVARRCEVKGEVGGVLFLDDYAHHPTEVQATLRAVREAIGQRRLVAVFQPHRYTRTKECLGTFGKLDADLLFVTDIYAAGEAPIAGVDPQQLIDGATYISRDNLVWELADRVREGDVVMTMGAGDVTHVGSQTMELLRNR